MFSPRRIKESKGLDVYVAEFPIFPRPPDTESWCGSSSCSESSMTTLDPTIWRVWWMMEESRGSPAIDDGGVTGV